MYEEAVAALEKSPKFWFPDAYLGNAYAVSGRRADALRLLEEWEERWSRGDRLAWNIAAIYAGLDEPEQALDWLEKAYEERHPFLLHMKVDPHLEALRSEPRFRALLRKMALN